MLLYVLGIVILVAVAVIGALVLRAGRQLVDQPGEDGVASKDGAGRRRVGSSAGGAAGLVDGSVRRARVAVAELISTDVHRDDLRPSTAEFSRRGHTYTVLGGGLVGLAAALLLGLLLVL